MNNVVRVGIPMGLFMVGATYVVAEMAQGQIDAHDQQVGPLVAGVMG